MIIKRGSGSTLEQVLKMLKLRLKGISYFEIGKRFNRHHSTVLYWCHLYDVKPIIFLENEIQKRVILIKKNKIRVGKMPRKIIFIIKKDFSVEKIKSIYKKNTKIKNENKILKIKVNKIKIKKDGIRFCRKCGKIKINKKWIRTKYCSLVCWDNFYYPRKRNICF